MSQEQKHIYDVCKEHVHSYVLAELHDGTKFDGIVTGVDNEYVYFAVPVQANDVVTQESFDRFGFPGPYGFPGYGYGFGPRRFRRLVLPLAALVALTALPWY